ncbi:hypothetical protein Cs7R123_59600 [Catellatospora sp. TT07R-123]|nr:hypothetical protein Cs7R123_59600 [Catellatospora sp. TT07R-123]
MEGTPVRVVNDLDASDWHDLLNRAHRAERDSGALADAVLRDHDDSHAGCARWCASPACRLAADLRR